MINKEKTLRLFNIDIDTLKPNSQKEVFWNCNQCNIEKIKYYRYAKRNQLCLSCSNKINANINKQSKSEKLKLWHKNNDHPLLGKKRPEHIRKILDKTGVFHSKETKKKLSEKSKGSNNGFYGKKHSKEIREMLSKNAKKNAKRGKDSIFYGKCFHGKRKYYLHRNGQSYLMRSTWEIKYATYLDKNNIEWEYENKTFPLILYNKKVTYTPDFFLPKENVYIEIKGWWRDDAKEKYKAFIEQYKDIKIKVYEKSELQKLGVL